MDIRASLESIARRLDQLKADVEFLRSRLDAAPASPADAAQRHTSALVAFLALGPSLEEDALLGTILRCAMQITKASGAGLTIFDSRRQKLVFRAAVGEGAEQILGYEVPLEGSQHGLAFATGEIQCGAPLHRQVDALADTAFRQVLVAPLMAEGQPIGTISAVNKQQAPAFTPEDMETYALFADLAALVVRQRMREELLRGMLEGRDVQVPNEVAQLAFGQREQRLLRLVGRITELAARRENALAVLDQVVGLMGSGM